MASRPLVRLYVNGAHRASSTGSTFVVRNAFSGKPVTTAAAASSADCLEAINSAQRAFPAWEALSPWARHSIFCKAADIMDTEAWKKQVREAMVEETSSTPSWLGYHTNVSTMMRAYASMVNELKGQTFPSCVPGGGQVIVQRRAQGVVFVFYIPALVLALIVCLKVLRHSLEWTGLLNSAWRRDSCGTG